MEPRLYLCRSVLYIPASKPRALKKARDLEVDAIIFDLEDAVSVDEKDPARATLLSTLAEGGYGNRMRIVRINGLDTSWGQADAKALTEVTADAVLLPKTNCAADLDALAEIVGDLPIWAMMETPEAVLRATEIAAHPKLHGMVMGTNDLAKDMQVRYRPDRLQLQTSLQLCLLAAKTYGKAVIDGVYNAFKDEEGLKDECVQGRDLGFDGKTLIHPSQIAVANSVFAPSDRETDLARRQIAAFNEAQTNRQGVAVVDGQIVENLHIATAREILAKSAAIKALRER